jgi:ribosomal protein S18 acetylase RimI-like enzyme
MEITGVQNIKFRPAVPEDLSFVLTLHHETLKEYIEPIWGWDKAKWDGIITKWFRPERVRIIHRDLEDIGILVVEEKKDEIFFESISLIPRLQGQGLGSNIIQGILRQAKEKMLPVRLDVLKTNQRAQRLYSRLGFRTQATTDTHFKMESMSI